MTKYEKALNQLNSLHYVNEENYKAVEELVERATPKEVLNISEDEHWFQCPNCLELIGYDILKDHKYCLECGQALDLSDDNA